MYPRAKVGSNTGSLHYLMRVFVGGMVLISFTGLASVVGSGSTLAYRLTKHEATTVLLLEAEGADREVQDIQIPAIQVTLVGGVLAWTDRSVPQKRSCSHRSYRVCLNIIVPPDLVRI